MPTKKKQTTRNRQGVLHSVYLPKRAILGRLKQAAKAKGVKLSVFMRDACVAEAERVLARKKKTS